ncbi:hypothetical protein ACIQ6V_25750 [Streptomyces sp. NPDC096198]|uniref:hypothetical protein n=1 Tax=Streptomyces sp. NPDC096198 TaxID=3366080 RepID=UPI0037F17BA6
MFAVIVGIVALAVGAPQRPDLVQRIYAAGGEFGVAQAEKVSDVRQRSSSGKDPYTSTAVVLLPVRAGEKPVTATVTPTTYEPLRPGDPVTVLYAPAHPRLGAVAGDEHSLGWKLRGETMPAYMRWFLVAALMLSWLLVVNHLSTNYGFRAFARLSGKDRAIRGGYTGVGGHFPTEEQKFPLKSKHLEIRTEAGRARFYADTGESGLPEAMVDQQLWLCWDAHRGSRGSRLSPRTTPAAMVFDTGLVVHGMMNVGQTHSLNPSAVPLKQTEPPMKDDRALRVFDPRSHWPLYIEPLALQTCVVVIACAALLTFDIPTGWRWAAGVVGFLGSCAIAGAVMSEGRPTKRDPRGR